MAATQELTILVKAKDSASASLRSIAGLIGKTLTLPIGIAGRALDGFLKNFLRFGALKKTFIELKQLFNDLAKNAKDFEPFFSSDDQARIDKVATAFNKLSASVKAFIGGLLAAGSDGLGGFLDGVSDFLRDHKQDAIDFLAALIKALKEIAAIIRAIAAGTLSLKDVFAPNAFGIPTFAGSGAAIQKALATQARGDLTGALGRAGVGRGEIDAARIAAIEERILASTRERLIGGFGESPGSQTLQANIGADRLRAMAEAIARLEDRLPGFSRAATDAGIAIADVFGTGGEGAAGFNAVASAADKATTAASSYGEIVREIQPDIKSAAESQKDLAEAYAETAERIREASEIMASNITDGLFAIVDGTKKAGAAIRDMVTGILREIARLYVNRAFVSFFTSLLSSFAGGAASSGTGASQTGQPGSGGDVAAGGYGGGGYHQFASGGRMSRSGFARVGERGPETVYLPAGAEVSPTTASSAPVNITFNIVGARDPKQTAREVMSEIRGNSQLRKALRLA